MRSSSEITPADDDERYVWAFDQREIDHPNPRAYTAIAYRRRLDEMLAVVRAHTPPGGSVADVGCAQGNLALLLAEQGYRVTAYDRNPSFLAYSRKKHERGDVEWLQGDFFAAADGREFDTVVLGEIVEHVAHPDELLARAAGRLAPGGVLVVTTPNGEFVRERLPSYAEVVARGELPRLEEQQFGPGGEHHLFAYTRQELVGHVPAGLTVVDAAYVGSALVNSHVQRLLDSRAGTGYERVVAGLHRSGWVRRRLGATLVLVARRTD